MINKNIDFIFDQVQEAIFMIEIEEEKVIIASEDIYTYVFNHVKSTLRGWEETDQTYRMFGVDVYSSILIPRDEFVIVSRPQYELIKEQEKEHLKTRTI